MEESRVPVCFNASCRVADIAGAIGSGRSNDDYMYFSFGFEFRESAEIHESYV
jgi:hypothetical protein